MGREYSEDIWDMIGEALEDEGWRFICDNGRFFFQIDIEGPIRQTQVCVMVGEDHFMVTASCPIRFNEKSQLTIRQMSLFAAMVNHGLLRGNFELDFGEGVIRYKTSVGCWGLVYPSREMVISSIAVTVHMMERFSPGIVGILFQGLSAAEAVELCRGR